jgi:glycosyltransferase involved in cell wall biosynthesis
MTGLTDLQPDLALWLADFEQSRGRAPRILHIGNVGNNGYNNAKLLNRAGLDCDTLCYDYYHIMGCPEWEDADFHGDIKSDFYPTWEGVDLRGFQRPRWFAQGPLLTCIDYLLARREGRTADAEALWARMRDEREGICSTLRGDTRPSFFVRAWKLALKVFRKFRYGPILLALKSAVFRKVTIALGMSRFVARVDRLCRVFPKYFPDRADRLVPIEFSDYIRSFPCWERLIRQYDLVVGYATDGIYPLMVGNAPYVAFEHGTIRNIPFEPTAQGRLCALTYRLCDVAFVTNCDNNLAIPHYKWVPHPINEDEHPTTEPARVRREVRAKLNTDFVIFHPSRHHWDAKRDTSWDKGNDILIDGFARFVREVCPTAGAVFVEWGQTLKQTRELLARHGVEKNVLWIQPQPTARMNAYILASDVLADQFCIGTFGGIMPKGLLFGTPNLIYLEENVHRWCLPELPPVLNTRTPDEVFAALKRLYEDRAFAQQVADDGRAWYARYHSSQVIVEAFRDAVRDAVARTGKEA